MVNSPCNTLLRTHFRGAESQPDFPGRARVSREPRRHPEAPPQWGRGWLSLLGTDLKSTETIKTGALAFREESATFKRFMATQSFFTMKRTQNFYSDFQGLRLADGGVHREHGSCGCPIPPSGSHGLSVSRRKFILLISACFALKQPGYTQLSTVSTCFWLL